MVKDLSMSMGKIAVTQEYIIRQKALAAELREKHGESIIQLKKIKPDNDDFHISHIPDESGISVFSGARLSENNSSAARVVLSDRNSNASGRLLISKKASSSLSMHSAALRKSNKSGEH